MYVIYIIELVYTKKIVSNGPDRLIVKYVNGSKIHISVKLYTHYIANIWYNKFEWTYGHIITIV